MVDNDVQKNMNALVEELKSLSVAPRMRAQLAVAHTPNFWTILEYGKEGYEIRFSKMLRWLLDPTANHGLGDYVLRSMARFADAQLGSADAVSIGEQYVPDNRDGAETEALRKHIDVFAHERNARICVTVETKMGTDEHASMTANGEESQLKKYYDTVTGHAEYGTYAHSYFIFLTEDGHVPPSFPEDEAQRADWQRRWVFMSYADLRALLDTCMLRLADMDAMKIVSDFRTDVTRKIDMSDDDLFGVFDEYRAQVETLHDYFFGDDEDGAKASSDRDLQSAGIAFLGALGDRMPLDDAKFLLKMVYDHIHIGRQDHRVNKDVQKLVRRIFNHYAERQLDISDPSRFGTEPKDARTSPAKPAYASRVVAMRMTNGKGQGLLFAKDSEGLNAVYLSGSSNGTFPNDPIRAPRGSALKAPAKSDAATLLALPEDELAAFVDAWIDFSWAANIERDAQAARRADVATEVAESTGSTEA